MRLLAIMLVVLVFAQGCGRKGPLFMPKPEPAKQTQPKNA
jgi:predicted small lipoprotein YifL